jgi:hypothetical protein
MHTWPMKDVPAILRQIIYQSHEEIMKDRTVHSASSPRISTIFRFEEWPLMTVT